MFIYQCKCGNIITNLEEDCFCTRYIMGCDPYKEQFDSSDWQSLIPIDRMKEIKKRFLELEKRFWYGKYEPI